MLIWNNPSTAICFKRPPTQEMRSKDSSNILQNSRTNVKERLRERERDREKWPKIQQRQPKLIEQLQTLYPNFDFNSFRRDREILFELT